MHMDGTNEKSPQSVFLSINDKCIEFDKGIFVHAICKEFNLQPAGIAADNWDSLLPVTVT